MIFALLTIGFVIFAIAIGKESYKHKETVEKAIKESKKGNTNEANWGKVPGNSPAYFGSNPEKDIFRLYELEVIPNPPREFEEVEFRFTGRFYEVPGESARIKFQASRGASGSWDFEGYLNEMEIIQDGKRTHNPKAGLVTMSFKTPIYGIPPFSYVMKAEAYTVDGRSILSIWADVEG